MAYFDVLNFVLSPLLKMPPLLAVIVISLIISLIVILITKYTTNQELMKTLKEEINEQQKQIKELKNNPAKAMEVQKKAMEANMKYMSHSLKPTLITLLPIILIFGWMNANFAHEGIAPQQEFNVYAIFDKAANGEADIIVPEGLEIIGDKKVNLAPAAINKKNFDRAAMWTLKGQEGEHIIEILYNDEKQQKSVLIDNAKYIEPSRNYNGMVRNVQIEYKPKKILNIFGWKIGWLGTYIIFSILFTSVLRKFMKVY
ncbi:DUF106 domain-containing protein [Candidatus Woesearchaeota archaeon]|nr:DUF106 domain-containing protein [Candidatus Woesearchaeota archaeon]